MAARYAPTRGLPPEFGMHRRMLRPMSKLHDDIAAAEAARLYFMERCLVVWRDIETIQPDLAAVISKLGLDEATTAEWICTRGPSGQSPAGLVAAGQAEEVKIGVLRGLHGFSV
jgi:hypothetical protein